MKPDNIRLAPTGAHDAIRIALVLLTMVAVSSCLITTQPFYVTGWANLASLLALTNYVLHGENP